MVLGECLDRYRRGVDPDLERIKGRDLIRRGPFARLWWANSISSLGDWVTLFATFSLAVRISGGGRNSGLAILVPLVARILPGLIIGVVAGVLADRWDRKKTMVVADFGRAGLVALLVLVGNFRDLFILTFAIEVLTLVRQPARESVVPQLIAPKHLAAANGLNLFGAYGTAPLGSALFAVIAEVGARVFSGYAVYPGVAAAFTFDAITFLVSGLIMMTVAIPTIEIPDERAATSALDFKAPLRDMATGFRFVATYSAVRRTVVGIAAGLFGGGALFVLGHPFSDQVLSSGDAGYGALVTALGVGVGLGMAAMTFWGRMIQRREPLFGGALVLTGVSITAAGLASTVAVASGWIFVAGLGTGIAYVTGFTHLHTAVTDDIRGRTFAALFAAARAALLVSFGLAGVGSAALDGLLPGILGSGVRAVILASGLVILLSGAGTVWAVRAQLASAPLEEEDYRALRDAGDALTWMRGDRRSKD